MTLTKVRKQTEGLAWQDELGNSLPHRYTVCLLRLARHPPAAPPLRCPAGAFGWVQRARNRETGEEVAVKFIELGPRFYPKYVEREIINHRLLAHPHIVGFKEVFVTQKVRVREW